MNEALDIVLLDGFVSGDPDDQHLPSLSPFKRFLLLFVSFVPVLSVNIAFIRIHHWESLMAKVAPVPFASTVVVRSIIVGVG